MRIVKKLQVTSSMGLHLRAAAKLVSMLSRFHSKVLFRKDNREANGRSLLNLIALEAVHGTQVEVDLDGEDAGEVFAAVSLFFEKGFFETPALSTGATELETAGRK